jgi:hypothetical protein
MKQDDEIIVAEQEENINNNNNNQEEKNETKTTIMNIFLNFSKFSNEEKEFFISFQNTIKILKILNLISNKGLKLGDIEILLKRVNPKGQRLSSDQFMNFIVLLTSKIYYKTFPDDPKGEILKFVNNYLNPLIQYIEDKNTELISKNYGTVYFAHKFIETKICNIKFDDKILIILNNVYNGLKTIYQSYFFYEINSYTNGNVILVKSLESLFEFCRDFEILPYIISMEKIAIFYNILVEINQEEFVENKNLIFDSNKEIGNVFTISKFASFLVHLAVISFEKFDNPNEDIKIKVEGDFDLNSLINADKLFLFFEKLENCKGFSLMEKKLKKPFTQKSMLIPSKEILLKVKYNY